MALEIRDQPDCGNAPRKEILRDLVIGLATPAAAQVLSALRADAQWHLAGDTSLTTPADIDQWVTAAAPGDVLTFDALITHGREASASGTVERADGTRENFCHVVTFANTAKTAPVVRVTSYIIAERP